MKKLLVLLIVPALIFMLILPVSAAGLPPSSDTVYDGIDVSKWQGDINFGSVADDGIKIVYIRVGADNDYEDPLFEKNYAGAKAAGLKIGFYFSMTASTEAEAAAQADFFTGLIAGKEYDCLPAMDYGFTHNISTATANANALAFLKELKKKTGGDAVIYTDAYGARSVWNSAVASEAKLWVAQYGVSEPEANGKWPDYVGWQYSDTGSVSGISGDVDKDHFTDGILLDEPASVPGDKIPPAAKTQKLITITVVRGDTLSALAREYDTTVGEIVLLNNIKNPDLIFVGQVLYIRVDAADGGTCVNTYTVKRGDTLTKIAGRFGTTVNRLAAINEIRNVNLIFIGQVLDLGACDNA